MLSVKGFFDYGITESCLENNYESTIKLLYSRKCPNLFQTFFFTNTVTVGYRTIAINQSLDTNDLEQKKKKKKGEPREAQSDIVPEPYKITPVEVSLSNIIVI